MGHRVIRVQAGGGFDAVDLTQEEASDPGAGEITVRIHASSLNYHDYGIVSGATGPKEDRIPMADGAGEVTAVGEGVTEFEVGDHVVSTFFPYWEDGEPTEQGFVRTPGDGIDGYAREQVTRPAHFFTRAPQGFSHAEAATLTTAGVTAWRALYADGNLQPGQTVLIQGTGGLSIFALQFAKMAGARVIATSSTTKKLDQLAEWGADELINYREDPEWGRTVRKLTGGVGVDHVVEVGGPDTLVQSMIAARVHGHIAVIGVLTGANSTLPVGLALARQLRLEALLVGSRKHQLETIAAVEATGLRPIIDRSFGLEEIVDAFRYQESGRHLGKICLEY